MKKKIATALCATLAVTGSVMAAPTGASAAEPSASVSDVQHPNAGAVDAVAADDTPAETVATDDSPSDIYLTASGSRTIRIVLVTMAAVVGVLAFVSMFASPILGIFGIRV